MACAAAEDTLRILVGDDQTDVLEALRLLLKSAGHKTVTVESPGALLRASRSEPFDLILMDLNYARDTTSGQEGLDLLNRLHEEQNEATIVVMTAWGNIELAVEAMRRGASDFIQKPWDNGKLLDTIRKQSRRRDRSELELARHVQQKFFPKAPVNASNLECAARCVPAREVSGDFYDFVELDNHCTAFVLADVSGKGMPAALLMANLQATLRSQAVQGIASPVESLKAVNELFYASTAPEHYATLFYGQYDDRDRVLTYVNCGHPAPVMVRSSGDVERLDSTATVLGLFGTWDGQQARVRIEPGDLVAMFSDGVTEAPLPGALSGNLQEEYGEERLIALLRSISCLGLSSIVDRVLESVMNLTGATPADDMTVAVLRGITS